jgi:hypothetical protein
MLPVPSSSASSTMPYSATCSSSKFIIKADFPVKSAGRTCKRPGGAKAGPVDYSCSAVHSSTDVMPHVPPEKWLIKAGPKRNRYETVKVSALKEPSPSLTPAPLSRSTSAVSSDAEKLVSASYNVKVVFPRPLLHRVWSLNHRTTHPPPPPPLIRDYTAPIALRTSNAHSLKRSPIPLLTSSFQLLSLTFKLH